MPETILDGTGSGGYEAKVDNENKLHTRAITEPSDKHANREGLTWSLPFSVIPVGAGDFFFYMKNEDKETLTITDIRAYAGAADTIEVVVVDGTPTYMTGTDIQSVNRNLNSNKEPVGVFKYDTDITGLNDNGEVFFVRMDTANKTEHLRTTSTIMIPRGRAVAFRAVTGTKVIKCIVSISTLHTD